MKLRTKFILISGIMVALVGANATLGYISIHHLDDLKTESDTINNLRILQMQADMMHDAMRGDVMNALAALKESKPELKKQALDDFHAHSERIDEVIGKMKSAQLPDDLRRQADSVSQQFVDYKQKALNIFNARSDDSAQMDEAYTAFEAQFRVLEQSQQQFGEDIPRLQLALDKKLEESLNSVDNQILFFSALTLLFTLFLPVFVTYAIFRRQAQMIKSMEKIAAGQLDTEVPHVARTDEIGSIAHAVQVFRENGLKMAEMTRQQQEAERKAQAEKKLAMQQLASNFESQVKNVVDMVASAATEMDATAKNVSHIAEDSQKKLGTLTADVNQASDNVDTVASATTQLSQAISDINRQISRASTITGSAVEEAQKADGTVQELVAAAGKIGEVISMINSIAEQINLLALNATIEAARAGDAGKGFAVVASEVKALATQTTKATSEITEYVASIQGTTHETVGVIKAIIGTIQEISAISTTIAAAVEEQGVATQDIARNVQQAAQSTREASQEAGEVTKSANETGDAAHQMTAATTELSKQAEKLRSEVEKFLTGVRSAA